MNKFNIISICLIISFSILSFSIYKTIQYAKNCDRTITVKGLAEEEHMADKVIWSINFIAVNNELKSAFNTIDQHTKIIRDFLISKGIKDDELTYSSVRLVDKEANEYCNSSDNISFRYFASKIITVCSHQVEIVKQTIIELGTLSEQGVIFDSNRYDNRVDYQFTALNSIKPKMVEQATINAREVAQKFSKDSQSILGKIKRASQGSFSIENRDINTPYIKKIRVVSTITYYISSQ